MAVEATKQRWSLPSWCRGAGLIRNLTRALWLNRLGRARTSRETEAREGARLTPLEFGDEEDFAAVADRLEIGGLVDRAVDRDGGFFFEVLAETGVEAVHFLDDAAQVPRFDGEFAHAAGVAAAEPRGEDDPRGHVQFLAKARPSPTQPPP